VLWQHHPQLTYYKLNKNMKNFILASQVTGAILITLFLLGGLLNSYGMDIKPIWFVRGSTFLLLIVWVAIIVKNKRSKS